MEVPVAVAARGQESLRPGRAMVTVGRMLAACHLAQARDRPSVRCVRHRAASDPRAAAHRARPDCPGRFGQPAGVHVAVAARRLATCDRRSGTYGPEPKSNGIAGQLPSPQHGAMENPWQSSPSDNLRPRHEPKRAVPLGLNPTHLPANRGSRNLYAPPQRAGAGEQQGAQATVARERKASGGRSTQVFS